MTDWLLIGILFYAIRTASIAAQIADDVELIKRIMRASQGGSDE